MADFFAALDALVGASVLRLDRPRGTAHPRFPDVVYPVDYGYLENTTATDGQGIDVFRGTASDAGVVAVIFSIDGRKRDLEVKVLIDCSDDEIGVVEGFLSNRLHLDAIVLRRP